MINLLAPQEKKQITAGRVNVLLRRYCIVSLSLLGLLAVTIAGFYLLLTNNKSTAQEAIDEGNRKLTEYQAVQKNVDSFKNNLSTAKAILGNEVHYSSVIAKIAKALPSNVVLQSLTLDSSTFGAPTSLSALGKTNNDALRLKTSLEESGIFQNVHLESISSAASGGEKGDYPVSISINVTLKPEVGKQ